jgi:ATP-dependent Clp protease ATP-binding subunit ClpC
MFDRYAPPSRRAIYFAREAALHAGADSIDSTHIASGLLVEEPTRANRLFHLSQRFPEETARLRALTKLPQARDIPLSKDSRRIVAYAAEEANRLNDYWIDTDHMVLGILRQGSSGGAAMLRGVGLEIGEARRVVVEAVPREDFGPEPSLWWLERPITRIGKWAGILYLLGIVTLIRILTEHGCASPAIPRK